MSLRIVVLGAALGCGVLFAAAAPPAAAQHVVTDDEAGKLTLDALTATPRPVYRPMFQRAMAVRRAHRPGYVSHLMHASSRVAFRYRPMARGRRR